MSLFKEGNTQLAKPMFPEAVSQVKKHAQDEFNRLELVGSIW